MGPRQELIDEAHDYSDQTVLIYRRARFLKKANVIFKDKIKPSEQQQVESVAEEILEKDYQDQFADLIHVIDGTPPDEGFWGISTPIAIPCGSALIANGLKVYQDFADRIAASKELANGLKVYQDFADRIAESKELANGLNSVRELAVRLKRVQEPKSNTTNSQDDNYVADVGDDGDTRVIDSKKDLDE